MNARRSRPTHTAADLVREVKAERIAPFYLLHGEEEYERDRAASWLVEQLSPVPGRDFNVAVFDVEQMSTQDVLTAYQSYPLMAPRRVIVLRRIERLEVDSCRALEPMVDKPMETSVVIAVGGKIDQRRRLFRQWAQLGFAVEFRIPYEAKLPAWVRRQARRAGVDIDAEAVDMLVMLIGRNLRQLAGEIDKAMTFVGDDGRITREVIAQLAGAGGQVSIFDMADAVGHGDRRAALTLLHKLLDHGQEPIQIIGLLGRHFRLLLMAKDAMAAGVRGKQALAAKLGVSSFFVGGYLEQARASSAERLWAAMAALLLADSRLRSSGRRQAALTMDLLVTQLCPATCTGGSA